MDFRLAPGERESAWTSFLLSLYCRGLRGEKTKLFIHDGSEGLENALDCVFGPGGRQRCICHKLGNLWDAVADKDAHGAIRKDAAAIYDVETVQEARDRLAAFALLWGDREPKAVAVLTSDFEYTLRFLMVPREHRSWVTTTNPLERSIRELRRRTRPMGTFQGPALRSAHRSAGPRSGRHPRRLPMPSHAPTAMVPPLGPRGRRPRSRQINSGRRPSLFRRGPTT